MAVKKGLLVSGYLALVVIWNLFQGKSMNFRAGLGKTDGRAYISCVIVGSELVSLRQTPETVLLQMLQGRRAEGTE